MKHFYVITNVQKDPGLKVAHRIQDYLQEKGIRCTLQEEKENSGGEQEPEYKSSNPDKIPDDVDCVLVLGGDGTVLRAARDLVKRHLPLFGVNLGTLGYLAEVDQDHLETALDHLVLGEYITEEHMMLRGVVCHEGQEILSDVALNDIVIARSGRIHVMDLKIYVNDRFLNEYSAVCKSRSDQFPGDSSQEDEWNLIRRVYENMKIQRHAKIVELINQYDIDTQEELARQLKEAGFRVTQATVSRDIRELRLTKIAVDGGKQKYVVMNTQSSELDEKYLRILRDGFVSMDMAQNILVIRTVSGMAMAVAAAMDALNWKEIAGCIAGDDTIMCAIRSVDDTLLVMDKIQKILDVR